MIRLHEIGGSTRNPPALVTRLAHTLNTASLDLFSDSIGDCGCDEPDCHRFVAGKSLSFHEAHNGS